MTQGEGVVCINGEFYPAGEGKISVLDSGFWHGINVFDTLSVRQGFIFKLEAHLERFFRGLHTVRIAIPYSREELGHLVVETVRRSGLKDAYVQCIATRGMRTAAPIDRWEPTTIVLSVPYFAILDEEVIHRGARVRISSIRNVPLQCVDPKVKNFNRLHSYLARLEALDSGADDPLLLDLDGYVTEGRAANVFAVRHGKLYTPAEGMLLGITRETVFEIAEAEGIPAVETRLTPHDLYNADEVFYATTAGGIIPIVEVDGRQIADGHAGRLTRRIERIYWRLHVEGKYATPIFAEAVLAGAADAPTAGRA